MVNIDPEEASKNFDHDHVYHTHPDDSPVQVVGKVKTKSILNFEKCHTRLVSKMLNVNQEGVSKSNLNDFVSPRSPESPYHSED